MAFARNPAEQDRLVLVVILAMPENHRVLRPDHDLPQDSSTLPVVSKKVSDIAKLAIQKMDDNIGYEAGSDSFPQYKRIINDFIVL